MKQQTAQYSAKSMIASNSVLRNTYLLLSLTLLFSALTAGWAMAVQAQPLNIIVMLIVYLGFPFAIQATRNSPVGLVLTFAFTGIVGWTLGPILNFYISTFSNGSDLIMMALGSTGLIFLGLSALALNPQKDYSGWGRFLSIGIIVAIIASLVNIFILKLPAFQLALSVIFALISGGLIMYQTNMIVRGGETNYISATVTLYISILNLFLALLQLLGAFAGNRN